MVVRRRSESIVRDCRVTGLMAIKNGSAAYSYRTVFFVPSSGQLSDLLI